LNSDIQYTQLYDTIDALTFVSTNEGSSSEDSGGNISGLVATVGFVNTLVAVATGSWTTSNLAAGWCPTQNLLHRPVSWPGPTFSYSAWHAWWISSLQPATWQQMRLGPLVTEANKHAPIFTQSQSTFLTDTTCLAAASLLACSAAFCCSIKAITFFLASALLLHEDPWVAVLPVPHDMVIDAVGISDVPRISGGDFKPPNVLFALPEVAPSSLFDAKTPRMQPLGSTALGNMVRAFDNDLVKRENDGNTTVGVANLTGNAVGPAGFKDCLLPCVYATREGASRALQ
jgi:hypothetical protein